MIKLVISDLHLGKGRFLSNGQVNLLEDFEATRCEDPQVANVVKSDDLSGYHMNTSSNSGLDSSSLNTSGIGLGSD